MSILDMLGGRPAARFRSSPPPSPAISAIAKRKNGGRASKPNPKRAIKSPKKHR